MKTKTLIDSPEWFKPREVSEKTNKDIKFFVGRSKTVNNLSAVYYLHNNIQATISVECD